MSLQGLISGSECAVPFNPLSQVLKHTEGDRSLQQDRFASPSSSRLHHLPSTSAAPGSERDLALARQFFDGNGQPSHVDPGPLLAHHLPPQLGRSPLDSPALAGSAPDLGKTWEDLSNRPGFIAQLPRADLGPPGWSTEFSGAPAVSAAGPAQGSVTQRMNYTQMPYTSRGLYGGPMSSGMMYGGMSAMGAPMQSTGKGKGKDIDFEAAFAQAAASWPEQVESARITEVDDDVDQLAESLQGTRLQGTAEDAKSKPLEFSEFWNQLQNSELPPPQEDLSKWEEQFNQLMSSQRDDGEFDYTGAMQQAWEGGIGAYDDALSNETRMEFTDEGLPIVGPYVFEKDSKYLGPLSSTRSNLQAAKDLLEQNGSLTEVALLLEAAIQHNELGKGGYEAWVLLGETRSMDEREDAAMRALMEGARRAEEAGAAGEGMLSLAISFTNESLERASHTMLLRWLRARYPAHPIPEDAWKSLTQSSWSSHDRVTEVFLGLAREQYSGGEMDPDVQTALGVLFYTNNDFDRAKDCFESALAVRPKDFTLWNRLGSSLSNGNKPEEALGAYREALQLRPTYTRAIYNVGVACLNIGAYQEAAEHLLSALAMQDVSGGAQSDQLWYTLRRVFLSMNRQDLADLAKASTNVEVFRSEGFDF